MIKENLIRKIEAKTAILGVVGLGYVGLPLAVEKAKTGYKTIGFDIQVNKVNMVNKGQNYIGDILDGDLALVVNSGMLKATTDFSFIENVDCVSICVPTPLDAHRYPDLTYIRRSVEEMARWIHPGMLVVLESTTYPGTTEELVKPILEKYSELRCNEDFFLAFSPERVDPGNRLYKTKNTPKVVGGIGRNSTEVAAALYRSILDSDVFEASSPAVAEMEKLLENTYRNINIGLANELAIICNKMGINVWEVIEAAKTKPYGFQAFYPGPGVGGHCIPLDPFYLTWKAREFDCQIKLIETAGEINNLMPQYVVERAGKILNRFKKPLNGSEIFLLGVAYKQDIDDYRESPVLKVIENFEKEGAVIKYNDPYIPELKYKKRNYQSTPITEDNLSRNDLVVITTMHGCFDYEFIRDNSKFIFDTKNATKNLNEKNNIEVL